MVASTDCRYYSKNNISKKFDKYLKHMSERELFLTDHFEYISLKVVHPKNCQVLTFDEYERLEEIPAHSYFMR